MPNESFVMVYVHAWQGTSQCIEGDHIMGTLRGRTNLDVCDAIAKLRSDGYNVLVTHKKPLNVCSLQEIIPVLMKENVDN